jgi:hypothetical protein
MHDPRTISLECRALVAWSLVLLFVKAFFEKALI